MTEEQKVLIEEMTWTEVKRAIEHGKDTAIFACGSTEQHGPHLPIGTDAYLGTAVAERVARRLGTALVAPTLRPGCSEHHMAFPGSMTLRFETFVMLLEDYCTNLARTGFRKVVMLSAHGGNSDLMAAHLPAIAKKLIDRTLVYMAVPLPSSRKVTARFLDEQGISREAAGVHAGYAETSELLVVRPDLVRMEAAAPGRCDPEFYSPERIRLSQLEAFTLGIHTQSPNNGVLGDPTGANAEDGATLLDMRVEAIAAQVEALASNEPGSAGGGADA